MGRAWADQYEAARAVFAEADEVLGFALSRLCWEGPEEELQLTENTQPAILATSIAIYRAVADDLDAAAVMAGHSLGEYSALVAAGSLSFADALRLVKSRGRFMQEAVPAGQGAMAAVMGLDSEAVEALAAAATTEDEVCAIANFNSPEQTVVSGAAQAVERAVALASEQGARRAVLLPVSAPFHSPLMRPARERLEPMLRAADFSAPEVPVIANVDAVPVVDGATACDRLIRQVDSPVLWVDSVRAMVTEFGVESFIEIGPGSVLSGLARRIERETSQQSLAEPEKFEKFLAAREDVK
jgi:[acyl-carrier-protein] S-malonyltransferase